MSIKSNVYINLTKEQLDKCLEEYAKLLSKKIKEKNATFDIILVGGASILFNYNFRFVTEDVDCFDPTNLILMNELINKVAEKFSINRNWLNSDFVKSRSFSPKIVQYSEYYKSYGYGKLIVRTIKSNYLLAMKIISARTYKHDYSDIYGIIKEEENNGNKITKIDVDNAINDLFSDKIEIDKNAYDFAISIINGESQETYDSINKKEELNKLSLQKNSNAKFLNETDINYLINHLQKKK